MEASVVEDRLTDRAASLRSELRERWGPVPHSTRTLDSRGYDYPESPDDVFRYAAVCFVVDGQGTGAGDAAARVLLCRDESHESLEWEPPGGRAVSGERPAETAEREVREETGVGVDVRDLIATETLRFDHGHAVMPVLQGVFLAEYQGGEVAPEPAIQPRWFPVDDLPAETQYRSRVRTAVADVDWCDGRHSSDFS